MQLTGLHLHQGSIRADLHLSAGDTAEVAIIVDGVARETITVDAAEGSARNVAWAVPPELLRDGQVSLRFINPATDTEIGRYDIIAGAGLEGNMAAELLRLRAEFDLFRRAFLADAADPRLRAADRAMIIAEAAEAALEALEADREARETGPAAKP